MNNPPADSSAYSELPVRRIDRDKIGVKCAPYFTDELAFSGMGACGNFWRLVAAASRSRQNVGHLLTSFLAQGFRDWSPTREYIIAISVTKPVFDLHLVSKRIYQPSWLKRMPGWISSGADYVFPANVSWFGYWDGTEYYRIYDAPQNIWNQPYLVQYFGDPAPQIRSVDQTIYNTLLAAPSIDCTMAAIRNVSDVCIGRIRVAQSIGIVTSAADKS